MRFTHVNAPERSNQRTNTWAQTLLLTSAASLLGSSTSAAGTITVNPVADTYLVSTSPEDNYGSSSQLWVRDQISVTSWRTLIRFDVSSLGASQTIDSATLTFNGTPSSGDPVMAVFKLTNSWIEGQAT